MGDIELGKTYKLNKPTHINEGVIIHKNSPVQVEEVDEEGNYSVLYHDMENMPHILSGIKKEELAKAD